jgi:hypothetical protein
MNAPSFYSLQKRDYGDFMNKLKETPAGILMDEWFLAIVSYRDEVYHTQQSTDEFIHISLYFFDDEVPQEYGFTLFPIYD